MDVLLSPGEGVAGDMMEKHAWPGELAERRHVEYDERFGNEKSWALLGPRLLVIVAAVVICHVLRR